MSDTSRIFISHAGADRPWAEWARWHLERAGYPTELDCVDWKAGDNFVERMHEALERRDPMLLLLSTAYLDRGRYTTDEWTARFAQRRADGQARLIPLRIDGVDLRTGIWAPIVVPDLFDLGADEAVRLLLETVREVLGPPAPAPRRPAAPPTADAGPRPPGSLPAVWNADRRNPAFTGRDGVLNQVHDGLTGGGRVAVQALHGMGGVGKTQLALEYAYRFAGEYDVVWWVFAEQAGLIGEQFAALGVELGIVDAAADSTVAKSVVLGHLARQRRWLLIFDNVVGNEDVLPWLPRGGGHVLITSRLGNWHQIAHAVELDVLPRAEAVRFLVEQGPGLDAAEAGRLAEAVGDLPLALAQAADYLSETGMAVTEYRELLAEETQAVLALGRPVDYPRSLAAATTLSLNRLAGVDAAAAAILRLCAMLAPEPIPVDLIAELAAPREPYPRVLAALPGVLGNRLARQEAIGRIGTYGLARTGSGTVTVHRLTQAVVRGQMAPADSAELLAHLESVLGGMKPGDPKDSANWPAWARLLPHLLAVDPGRTGDPVLRECARDAVVYLLSRGDVEPSRQLADHLHEEWRNRLGADHRDTLRAATELAWALRELGEFDRVRTLIDDTLTRQTATLGRDDPDTLRSAADLAIAHLDHGDGRLAEEVVRDVWERRRRVLGEEHQETLTAANNVASTLSELERHEEALPLLRDVWERQRRVLGEDHPSTLTAAGNVASSLGELRRFDESLALAHDVWERQRRVMGEEHPNTLKIASNYATTLGSVGRQRDALKLLRDVWERQTRVLGEEHPTTLVSALNMAIVQLNLGRVLPARRLADQAWKGLLAKHGADHPYTRRAAKVRRTAMLGMGGGRKRRR